MRMRSKIAILMTVVVAAAACSTIPSHPRKLRYEPLHFKPPKPTRKVLGNGMVVYLLEDHRLPVVSAHFKIRTGRIYDPADKVGLAELTGAVLRTGGTETRSGDEIDELLDSLAASIETGIYTEEGWANFWTMSKDLDKTLPILADILRRPRFADDKIDLQKKAMAEAVRRRNDVPGEIVSREFNHLVYASSRAWAREPTLETLKRIKRDDVVAFYKRYFAPNNIIAGFAGDFDSDKLLVRLENLFGDWPRKDVAFPKIPPLADRNEPSVNYVHKNIPQSYIQLGHLGMRRHDPDYFAAQVMNYILGTGGFTSRLTSEIRSNRGLAYSVGAALTEGTDRGRFVGWCQTKASSTHQAISLMLDIIRRMATDPISDDEMAKAHSALVNRFVFRFETSQRTVNEYIRLEYYGYPKDYLDTYIDKIRAVTKDDVRRVARKYIHPDQMIIVVVGDKARFDKPLDDLGPVHKIALPKVE